MAELASVREATPAKAVNGAKAGFWLLIGVYAVMALITFDQVEEDAFIYFRTAEHIARGHGYVFNAGGERIETGSSLSWQFLLAGADLLSMNLLLFSKLVSLLLGGATLYLLWQISRRFIAAARIALLPSVLLALSIPFYHWVQRGLETSLYVFAIVLLAFSMLHERWKHHFWAPALLVALSRSEGFIVAAGLTGFLYYEWKHLRHPLRGVGLFAAVCALSLLGRLIYFHDLVPHPFYVKIKDVPGMPWSAVKLYFGATWLWVLLVLGTIGLLKRQVWSRSLIALAILELPVAWWALRTHALVQNNRHLLPALPLLYVLIGVGIARLLALGENLRLLLLGGLTLFLLWFGLEAPAMDMGVRVQANPFRTALDAALASPSRHAEKLLQFARPGRPLRVLQKNYASDVAFENWWAQVGEFIEKTYPRGITIAYDQMGQTPWYAGLDKTFVDTTGLTYRATGFAIFNENLKKDAPASLVFYRRLSDAILAPWGPPEYRSFDRQQAVDRVFALEPELIILNALFVSDSVPSLIARDPRLSARYVEKRKWFLFFHERKDMAQRIHWDPGDESVPGKRNSELSESR